MDFKESDNFLLFRAPNFNLNGSCKPFMKIFQVKTEVELYPNEKVAKTYKENTHDVNIFHILVKIIRYVDHIWRHID